jgi:hypothetical protein
MASQSHATGGELLSSMCIAAARAAALARFCQNNRGSLVVEAKSDRLKGGAVVSDMKTLVDVLLQRSIISSIANDVGARGRGCEVCANLQIVAPPLPQSSRPCATTFTAKRS